MSTDFARRLLRAQWLRLRRYCPDASLTAAFFVLGLPSYLRGLLRSRRHRVREQWSGGETIGSARRVAVFVHFDRHGHIHDWLEHYLGELRSAGYSVIFVSNAPRLSAEAVAKVRPHCGLVLRRDNIGHDFGAYRDGIGHIPDLGQLDALLLANDSVYGPFHPLVDILARMSPDQASVWGITDGVEGGFHLQSYFLLFHRAALQSGAFGRFWREYRYVQSRYWNILKYEIGLSRALSTAGIRCRALFSYRRAAAILGDRDARAHLPTPGRKSAESTTALIANGVPVNPTHDLWDVLIGEMGCPFIKRDLLRVDPARKLGPRNWRAVINSVSDYDTTMIPDFPPPPSRHADT